MPSSFIRSTIEVRQFSFLRVIRRKPVELREDIHVGHRHFLRWWHLRARRCCATLLRRLRLRLALGRLLRCSLRSGSARFRTRAHRAGACAARRLLVDAELLENLAEHAHVLFLLLSMKGVLTRVEV
jgi:hypothetical protein